MSKPRIQPVWLAALVLCCGIAFAMGRGRQDASSNATKLVDADYVAPFQIVNGRLRIIQGRDPRVWISYDRVLGAMTKAASKCCESSPEARSGYVLIEYVKGTTITHVVPRSIVFPVVPRDAVEACVTAILRDGDAQASTRAPLPERMPLAFWWECQATAH